MALIKCPECGNSVSNTSEVCVHCGFPVTKEALRLKKLAENFKSKQAYSLAFDHMRRSAELGNADAQNQLGYYYDEGIGTQKNHELAFQWFKTAAAANHKCAYYNLGIMYLYGQGIERDLDKAIGYFQIAADLGNTGAYFVLGRLYETGNTKDISKAIQYYKLSSANGEHRGSSRLGLIYDQGLGVPVNSSLAVKYYTLAISQGSPNPDIHNNLALCYINGTGTEVNYEKAEVLLKKYLNTDNAAIKASYQLLKTKIAKKEEKKNNEIFPTLLFLSDLEDHMKVKLGEIEEVIRNRWKCLPNIDVNTDYTAELCPYFDDIALFCDQYYSKFQLEIEFMFTDFAHDSLMDPPYLFDEIDTLLEALCNPYVEAFDSGMMNCYKSLERRLVQIDNSSSNSRYGYITNDKLSFLAIETTRIISESYNAAVQKRDAYNNVKNSMLQVHNRLNSLWQRNFESVFMREIKSYNQSLASRMIQYVSDEGFSLPYNSYLELKKTEHFIKAYAAVLDQRMAEKKAKEENERKIKEEKERKKVEEQRKKEERRQHELNDIRNKIKELDSEISSYGRICFGKTAQLKKVAVQKKSDLESRLNHLETRKP